MSDIKQFDTKCAVCGHVSKQLVYLSLYCHSSPDLDTHQPGADGIMQVCPNCGFVAGSISDTTDITLDFLNSEAYRTCNSIHFQSEDAENYYRRYLINCKESKKVGSFYSILHVAWECEKAEDYENAAMCRQMALELSEQVMEENPENEDLSAIRADLLRRTEQFQLLVEEYECRIYKRPEINIVISYQMELAKQRDSSRHTIAEAYDNMSRVSIDDVAAHIHDHELPDAEKVLNPTWRIKRRIIEYLVDNKELTTCALGLVETKEGRQHGLHGELVQDENGKEHWVVLCEPRLMMSLYVANKANWIEEKKVYRYSRKVYRAMKRKYSDYDVIILEAKDRYYLYDDDANLVGKVMRERVSKAAQGCNLTYAGYSHERVLENLTKKRLSYVIVHPKSEELYRVNYLEPDEENKMFVNGMPIRQPVPPVSDSDHDEDFDGYDIDEDDFDMDFEED